MNKIPNKYSLHNIFFANAGHLFSHASDSARNQT